MDFADIEIRAWREGTRKISVLVHSAPAGDTPVPFDVAVDREQMKRLADLGAIFERGEGAHLRAAALGTELTSLLFPPRVQEIFSASLQQLPPSRGLRLRLCMDHELAGLPWELLYRFDAARGGSVLDGFLVLDPRISVVRGAPTPVETDSTPIDSPRLVFAGAFGRDGIDLLQIEEEYRGLAGALAPVAGLLSLDPCISAIGTAIESSLSRPAAIFHYAGHVDIDGNRAYLVKEFTDTAERIYADALRVALAHAGTKLAVFTACNSAIPAFMQPLLRAGLQAAIGAHGLVESRTAVAFSERLYGFLAVGLSLDRAVVSARQHLVELGRGDRGEYAENCEWARFVVYMPAQEPVLFPQADNSPVRQRREAVLQADRGTMNRRALRQAMVRAFTTDDLRLLYADIEQELAADGIAEPLNSDVIGATGKGLEVQILDLIGYVERRNWYPYFEKAVGAARPELARVIAAH